MVFMLAITSPIRNMVTATIIYQASVDSYQLKIRWSSLGANMDTNEMDHRLWCISRSFRQLMDDESVACVAQMEVQHKPADPPATKPWVFAVGRSQIPFHQ